MTGSAHPDRALDPARRAILVNGALWVLVLPAAFVVVSVVQPWLPGPSVVPELALLALLVVGSLLNLAGCAAVAVARSRLGGGRVPAVVTGAAVQALALVLTASGTGYALVRESFFPRLSSAWAIEVSLAVVAVVYPAGQVVTAVGLAPLSRPLSWCYAVAPVGLPTYAALAWWFQTHPEDRPPPGSLAAVAPATGLFGLAAVFVVGVPVLWFCLARTVRRRAGQLPAEPHPAHAPAVRADGAAGSRVTTLLPHGTARWAGPDRLPGVDPDRARRPAAREASMGNIVFGAVGLVAGVVFLVLNLTDPAGTAPADWLWCAVGFVAGAFLLWRGLHQRQRDPRS